MISTVFAGNVNKMVTVMVRMDTSRIERVVNFAFCSIFLFEIMLNPPFFESGIFDSCFNYTDSYLKCKVYQKMFHPIFLILNLDKWFAILRDRDIFFICSREY